MTKTQDKVNRIDTPICGKTIQPVFDLRLWGLSLG
jgi:hypothetical protein